MCYQSLLSSSYIVPTSTSIPKFTISFLTSRTTLRINLAFKQFHTPTFHNNSAASAMVKPQFNAGDKVEYKPVGGICFSLPISLKSWEYLETLAKC